jgi:hypothetical protein
VDDTTGKTVAQLKKIYQDALAAWQKAKIFEKNTRDIKDKTKADYDAAAEKQLQARIKAAGVVCLVLAVVAALVCIFIFKNGKAAIAVGGILTTLWAVSIPLAWAVPWAEGIAWTVVVIVIGVAIWLAHDKASLKRLKANEEGLKAKWREGYAILSRSVDQLASKIDPKEKERVFIDNIAKSNELSLDDAKALRDQVKTEVPNLFAERDIEDASVDVKATDTIIK